MIEEIRNGNLAIGLNSENGQLCSIKKNSVQVMWGGGNDCGSKIEKGVWENSSPLMFPVVGPSDGITTGGIDYGMVQHGIARYLPWEVKKENDETIVAFQKYGGKPVIVRRKGKETEAQFPFEYELSVKHRIAGDSVESEFSIRNKSNKRMPYTFGWHPGFVISKNAKITAPGKRYGLKDVYDAETLLLEGINEVSLESYAGTIKLEHDFGNTMVWSPENTNLVCLEPVTGLPARTENGFIGAFDSNYLDPLESAAYRSRITPTVKI